MRIFKRKIVGMNMNEREKRYYEALEKMVDLIMADIKSSKIKYTEAEVRAYVSHSLACSEAEGWGYSGPESRT